MAIITISRETGAYGKEVSELLANELGLYLLDNKSLEANIGQFNIPDFKFDRYNEKTPKLWDIFDLSKDRYISYIKASIYKAALTGNCLVYGHAASIILADIPNVLRLRLVGSKERRARIFMQRNNTTDLKASLKEISYFDSVRSGFYRYFFDENWGAMEHYDLQINVDRQEPEDILKIVRALLSAAAPAEAVHQLIKGKFLAELIKIRILFIDAIAIDLLKVKCSDGIISLYGATTSIEAKEECTELVSAILAEDSSYTINNKIELIDLGISTVTY